jgi:hypothetical protein|tara:strand:+ start:34 stop:303 length:270 start_codon:yes stop_codon:yes gene_type:complete
LANVNAKKAEKYEKTTPDFIMKLINRSEPEKAETEKAAPVVQKAVVQKQHTTVKHYTTAKTPAATEVAAAPAKTKLPRSELNAIYHVKL